MFRIIFAAATTHQENSSGGGALLWEGSVTRAVICTFKLSVLRINKLEGRDNSTSAARLNNVSCFIWSG